MIRQFLTSLTYMVLDGTYIFLDCDITGLELISVKV